MDRSVPPQAPWVGQVQSLGWIERGEAISVFLSQKSLDPPTVFVRRVLHPGSTAQ